MSQLLFDLSCYRVGIGKKIGQRYLVNLIYDEMLDLKNFIFFKDVCQLFVEMIGDG